MSYLDCSHDLNRLLSSYLSDHRQFVTNGSRLSWYLLLTSIAQSQIQFFSVYRWFKMYKCIIYGYRLPLIVCPLVTESVILCHFFEPVRHQFIPTISVGTFWLEKLNISESFLRESKGFLYMYTIYVINLSIWSALTSYMTLGS